ncbi:MAG: glutamine-hydrolyzing GMP synthase, partial [Candidatus Aminicenantes bacterium]|nr:glutamine-hydrolyzing GMP synthase [Candidatus Aminicenantes bacterium]
LDFGSQYTQLIARKVRELGVFSEIFPFDVPLSTIKKENPKALILSGGPSSVYAENAPLVTEKIFSLGVPVLGICYGLQLMTHVLGGKVSSSSKREYGFATIVVKNRRGLLAGIRSDSQVWMSHGDKVNKIPEGFIITGLTANSKAAVIENREKKLFGVQFHPEVVHTKQGKKILSNFIFSQAGLKPDWTMGSFIQRKADIIRKQVKDGKVICGLSGGVDSLVASLIIHKAVGDNLTCIFIDNGLLRKGQYQDLMDKFREKFSLNVIGVDATEDFLRRLKRITSPERKRKIIGEVFIRIFEKEAAKIGNVKFLAQGTIYPDVIESSPVKGPSSSIKSHHNVAGLPKDLKFKLVEPLRELFKDEVRVLGEELGVDKDFIQQHPFPGPGLAVRIVGEVTRERLRILREADCILLEEIIRSGKYKELWQAFTVLLPIRSVGVMGDLRTYQRVVVIRLVQSVDGMTANWYPAEPSLLTKISNRIVNEVNGVNRVVYDITSKPPGTIEWE